MKLEGYIVYARHWIRYQKPAHSMLEFNSVIFTTIGSVQRLVKTLSGFSEMQ